MGQGLSGSINTPHWNRSIRDEESGTMNLTLVDEGYSAVLTDWRESKKDKNRKIIFKAF